jgi:hypothetical protein
MATAVDPGDEVPLTERPTIPMPAPRDSEVRVRTTRVPCPVATVDYVACDCSRDPRSEDFIVRMASGVVPAARRLELVLDDDDELLAG